MDRLDFLRGIARDRNLTFSNWLPKIGEQFEVGVGDPEDHHAGIALVDTENVIRAVKRAPVTVTAGKGLAINVGLLEELIFEPEEVDDPGHGFWLDGYASYVFAGPTLMFHLYRWSPGSSFAPGCTLKILTPDRSPGIATPQRDWLMGLR